MMYNNHMNFKEKMTISNTVFVQEIDDEMIIMDTQSENYFGLDTMGTQMWHILVENSSLDNLKMKILEMYDVEESVLEHDIEVFISELLKNKLITIG